MSTDTITVTWTTSIQETHTAEIPAVEFARMIEDGTSEDDLAEYENDGSVTSTAVTNRDIEDGFDALGGDRECAECGDEAAYLSSRDWCDGCEERDTLPKCDQCDTREGDLDYWNRPIELNRWPNLNQPVQMCPSCTHNARRSGWESGQ